MKAFLLIFIFLCTPPLLAKKRLKIESEPEYKSPLQGVRSPIKTFKALRKDLPNSSPTGVSFQKCSIYSKYLVHETHSGQVGSDTISIRRFGASDAFETVCNKKSFEKEIFLKAPGQVFEGAMDEFIFTRSAETFGVESSVGIYDGISGERLFEAHYNFQKPFIAKPQANTLVLSYFSRLELTCPLASDEVEKNKQCWEETLKINRIPANIKLKTPDCQEALKNPSFANSTELRTNPRALQIFVPINVTISKKGEPQITYKNEIATCNMAP